MIKKYKNCIYALFVAAAIMFAGCNETGQIENPVAADPEIYVKPTISNLTAAPESLNRLRGEILTISCEWESPWQVNAATATLCFVKTIKDTVTEPIGVIASESKSIRAAEVASDTADTASDTVELTDEEKAAIEAAANKAFYERFKDPIEIPTTVGTSQQKGLWSAGLTLSPIDLAGAPLGIVQQMTLYMTINGVKTNTLSFEITFTASETTDI